ncbi:MAG: RidA family protein [Hyphomicrobiales bacterium]|nr:RidA family protein [Hyphomicrobiales bacterium]
MTRRLISTGSAFEEKASYSRAVVDGGFVFVSGTTGYDYATMQMPEDAGQQTENILNTIDMVLGKAGASLKDVVKATYIITDAAHAEALFEVIGRRFKDIRPTNTLFIAGLLRPEMKVEIEVIAKLPAAAEGAPTA